MSLEFATFRVMLHTDARCFNQQSSLVTLLVVFLQLYFYHRKLS